MGTIARRVQLLIRSHLTVERVKWGSRAAAFGAWVPAVPNALADMPAGVVDSLRARRGDFSAEALYDLIPTGVRMKTESVVEFLGNRDLSHIESVKNAPPLESEITNVIFERKPWNRARGSDNMTGLELARARLDNFADGMIQGAKATTVAAARGAVIGALVELPVTAVENFLLVKGNGRTLGEASKQVIKDVGKSAAAGAAGSVIFTGVALIGLPMGPIAVPLAIVGGTMYTWSAADRIWRARGALPG